MLSHGQIFQRVQEEGSGRGERWRSRLGPEKYVVAVDSVQQYVEIWRNSSAQFPRFNH